MMEMEDVLAQLDDALDACGRMLDGLTDTSQDPRLRGLRARIKSVVERFTTQDSFYREELKAMNHQVYMAQAVRTGQGVLQALRDDIAVGGLRTVAELLRAGTFANFLDMAAELLDKDYKDPAAVIAGSVLESHLRLLCEKAGISPTRPNGGPKKADTMNADLVKSGAYNQVQAKAVTADLALRNSAAHGHYDEYDALQVKSMIDRVRDFIARNPA